MPANVESAAYANTPAWHQEGVVFDTEGRKGMTVPQALAGADLDWLVEKRQVFAAGANGSAMSSAIDGRFAVVRTSDEKPLGVVGNTWQPVQNRDGFQILADVMNMSDHEMHIEAAGALDGGKKVWILAHLDMDMQIAGEDVRTYLLFANGHDGRMSVVAKTTDVRVVCQNTLSWALSLGPKVGPEKDGIRSAKGEVRVRHTTKAGERIKQAQQILGIRSLAAEELAKQGEWLVDKTMSDGQFSKFLEKLMPFPDDDKDTSPARTMIIKRREAVEKRYDTAKNLKPIRGTRWGAFNAVVEWADYYRSFDSPNTQLKAQWGFTNSGQVIKDRAIALLSKK